MFERMEGRILLTMVMTIAFAGCAASPWGPPGPSDVWPDSTTATALEDESTGRHGGGGRGGGEPREVSWMDGNPFPLDEGLADARRRSRASWDAPDVPSREAERVRAAERPDYEPRDIVVRSPDLRPERHDRSTRESLGLRPSRDDARTLRAPRS
jgi:hypothetical protein